MLELQGHRGARGLWPENTLVAFGGALELGVSTVELDCGLTRDGVVSQRTFDDLEWHFSEREICDIVWLVASEHLYNLNNIGLNIGSEGLCDLNQAARAPERLTA